MSHQTGRTLQNEPEHPASEAAESESARSMAPKKHEPHAVTVDVIIMRISQGELQVLLLK